MLTSILHMPHQQLMNFLEETNVSLNKVNIILEYPGSGNHFFRKKIDDIDRLIHKVKGDAAAIDFEMFVKQCHDFEDLLDNLKKKKTLAGNDFLPVALALEELFQKRYMLDELFRKIASLVKEGGGDPSYMPEYLQEWYPLQQLADNIAAKYNKSVDLHFRGFKIELPTDYQTAIKDIAVQLIRNSVVHGIETVEQRKNAAKINDCQIVMSINYSYERGYVFTYMDDGAGINYEKVRSKLLEIGHVNAYEVQEYSEKQLLNAIFKSGFSSQESANQDAGRGVGLSVVAEKVRMFGSKIQVSSVKGKRTAFKIFLPCKSSMAA